VGGHVWTDEAGRSRPVVVEGEFGLVISLLSRPGHGPAAGVEHRVHAIPDSPLTSGEIAGVRELAAVAAKAVRDGRSVLVRCHYGYNRSGLLAAQALMDLGLGAGEAIDRLRERRSSWALHQPVFEQYLLTGLDVAVLLTDLEPPAL
jgi:hypothetical protein